MIIPSDPLLLLAVFTLPGVLGLVIVTVLPSRTNAVCQVLDRCGIGAFVRAIAGRKRRRRRRKRRRGDG